MFFSCGGANAGAWRKTGGGVSRGGRGRPSIEDRCCSEVSKEASATGRKVKEF